MPGEDDTVAYNERALSDRIRGRLASLNEATPPDSAEPRQVEAERAVVMEKAPTPPPPALDDEPPPQQPADDLKHKYGDLLQSYRQLKARLEKHLSAEAKCERLLRAHFKTIDDLTRALDVIEVQLPSRSEDQELSPTEQILVNVHMGVRHVRDRLYEVLTDENELECIDPAPGEPFDSQRHDAVESVPARYLDPGSVAEVVEVGYVFEGKTLRPAKVKVTVESQ